MRPDWRMLLALTSATLGVAGCTRELAMEKLEATVVGVTVTMSELSGKVQWRLNLSSP